MYVLLLVKKIQNKVFQTSIIQKKKDKIIQTCQQSLGNSVKTFSSVPFKIMNTYSIGNSYKYFIQLHVNCILGASMTL